MTQLPSTLRPAESDTVGDLNNLAYSFKPQRDNARIVQFGKLDPGETELEPGPLTWAAVKNKYFVFGLLNPAGSTFNEVSLKGGPRTSKLATSASATIVKTIQGGAFTLDLYAGPQQQTELIAVGRDFDHVNPYGWRFFQGMVQPIATLCIRLLLWMHQVLHLSYGWVLVIFGIMIRIILWPLNQSAMRSSMKMQELQPRLAEVQKKYKDKPEKQREEIMKVYKETGTSPFTALTDVYRADSHAGIVRALLRISEYDRVQGSSLHVAPRYLDEGSFLHPADPDGSLDVRPVLDWAAQRSAKSAGEDDELHVSCNDDLCSGKHGFGAESLLHGAKPGCDSTAMASCERRLRRKRLT